MLPKSFFMRILVIILLLMLVSACMSSKKRLTPNEKLTIKRIAPYCEWLEDYRRENMYYPDTWWELLEWKSVTMPENPYTGKPMVALSSKEFDPEKSPGNIYYMRVFQEGNVINSQVIVFGEKGEIARWGSAARFAAK